MHRALASPNVGKSKVPTYMAEQLSNQLDLAVEFRQLIWTRYMVYPTIYFNYHKKYMEFWTTVDVHCRDQIIIVIKYILRNSGQQ